jgi:hypothetical protein
MLRHFAGHFAFGNNEVVAGSETSEQFARAVSVFGENFLVSESGRLRIAGNCMRVVSMPPSPYHHGCDIISAVAGDLHIYESHSVDQTATDDQEWLATRLMTGDYASLANANGTFAAAIYLPDRDELVLSTDSLGARPLYYRLETHGVWFSTSFDLLQRLSRLQNAVNLQALAEQFAFCYPLRERTAALEVSVLRDNEYLLASRSGSKVQRYFDWRELPIASRNAAEELRMCADAFHSAVRCRMSPHGPQLALLSGGLDSRCIVATLRAGGSEVNAATIAWQSSLDYYYAREFAKAAEVNLVDVGVEPSLTTTPGKRTQRLLVAATEPFHPQAVFSGDGGGETFGFLIMSQEIISLLAKGQVEEALQLYSRENALPLSIMSWQTAQAICDAPYVGMKQEFEELAGLHPEKAFQLFLLRNDLRRHLHDYFDSLDENVSELLLPFYDRRVVASVLRIAPPLQDYIRHAFFYRLLESLPQSVRAVRWQAYPKSLPCPLPGIDPAPDQWERAKEYFAKAERGWRKESLRSLLTKKPANSFIRPERIAAAAILDFFRLRRYGYLFMSHLAIRDFCRLVERSEEL